jgi:RND family efflux transporter MFP subunit
MSNKVSPTSFHPGTGRRLKLMVGGLILVLLVGFLIMRIARWHHDAALSDTAQKDAAAPTPVEVVTAHPAQNGTPMTLPGETAAWYESIIYARVNGYVGTWTADIGDHVKKGQVLATIETPELDADLLAAKAKLRAGEAEVNRRQAEAEFADTTYARWRDSPKGVVSEQEREDKKAQFSSAKANLEAAKAQSAVAQAEVDRLNSFQQFKQVTAPYSGTITERRIDIGNLSTQTTPLYHMAKDDPIRVFVEVPQSAAADLMKDGAPVDIVTSDGSARHFSGQVTRTSQAIDPKARTFRAEIDLPNADLALLPGMYVQANFQLANHGAMRVPASAMMFRTDGPHVAVVGEDQKVHIVPVTIARDDGSLIELGSGVKDGDKVVLNISNQTADGDAVHITAIDGKPAP